jgi:hypothetical protein
MKRSNSILALGTLCAAVLVTFYCMDINYDNPLDEKGDNFLYGRDLTEDEKKLALDTNGQGQAGLFWHPNFQCDTDAPAFLRLKPAGSTVDTVYKTSSEVNKFNRLVGFSGWGDILEYPASSGTLSIRIWAELKKINGEPVTYARNEIPELGQYDIEYHADWGECDDGTPKKKLTVNRRLIVEPYNPAVTDKPAIIVLGQRNVSVDINGAYTDPGVVAIDDPNGRRDTIPITKIQVYRVMGTGSDTTWAYQADVPVPAATNVPFNLPLPSTATERTYVIVYHTVSKIPNNNQTATETRTVSVSSSVVVLPTPVIVLNTYRHTSATIAGLTIAIDHQDTAFVIGRGAPAYVEKGVKRAYYVNSEGREVDITDQVQAPTTPQFDNSMAERVTVRYRIAQTAAYAGVEATRAIYTYYNDCDIPMAPTIAFNGADPLTIPAGQQWTHASSWRVTGQGDEAPSARQYIIDFGGMNPDNPVAKSGGYTITYVALGGCGNYTVRTRTVIVQ